MARELETEIEGIIAQQLTALNRPDLFRQPLVAFSSADDARYASLKKIIGEWHQSPTEILPGAASVISYFVPFTQAVAKDPNNAELVSPLWGEAYVVINRHFDVINRAVCGHLISLGHSAIETRPTNNYDPKDLKCEWSHRSAAAIAGLGAFGANGLLMTKKGTGGRYGTVITTAKLNADRHPAENKCLFIKNGSCGLCFKVCPAKALSPNGTDRFACQDRLDLHEVLLKDIPNMLGTGTCGKCISVCPFAYIA